MVLLEKQVHLQKEVGADISEWGVSRRVGGLGARSGTYMLQMIHC